MAPGRVQVVLLDVGGTLWPHTWEPSPQDELVRIRRVSALTGVHPSVAAGLVETIRAPVDAGEHHDLACRTDARIGAALRTLGVPGDGARVRALRRALCLPAVGRVELLDGVPELLRKLTVAGLTTVIVSNTTFRDAEVYREDFEQLGIGHYIDAVVTSVDVGWNKPHPAMFRAALDTAAVSPDRCVMVGDSETCDIEPAVAFGMRAVRVALEQARAQSTCADVVVDSLSDVARAMSGW